MLASDLLFLLIGQLPEITYYVVLGIGYFLCVPGIAFLCIGLYQGVLKLTGKYVPFFLVGYVFVHGIIDLAIGLIIVCLFKQGALVWTVLILLGLVAYSLGSNFFRQWYMKKAQILMDRKASSDN